MTCVAWHTQYLVLSEKKYRYHTYKTITALNSPKRSRCLFNEANNPGVILNAPVPTGGGGRSYNAKLMNNKKNYSCGGGWPFTYTKLQQIRELKLLFLRLGGRTRAGVAPLFPQSINIAGCYNYSCIPGITLEDRGINGEVVVVGQLRAHL